MLKGGRNETIRTEPQAHSSWFQTEVGLYSSSSFQLIIEASLKGTGHLACGTVSLDDIDVKDGNCVSTCSAVTVTSRVSCGPPGVSGLQCVRTYGCCYSNQVAAHDRSNYGRCPNTFIK